MAESTEDVTDTFHALADPVRRYVLYSLDEQENPVSFDRLATRVAAWRADSDLDAVDDATLAEIRTALYHVHLPQLADFGVITYEATPGEIALTDDTDSLDPFLEPARQADLGTEPPSEQLYVRLRPSAGMTHADDDTEAVGFESALDPIGDSVSLRVVEAVATFYEVAPTDLDPLYSAIAPDALDALFALSRAGRRLKGVVTFRYENVAVSVNGDGTIRLSDPE